MLADYGAFVRHLLSRGLIQTSQIVGADLSLLNSSSRNCNIEVRSKEGSSYFLKQDAKVDRAQAYASIAYEAAVYDLLLKERGAFVQYLPSKVLFDPEHNLLVLEAILGAQDLSAAYFATGQVPIEMADEVGRALGTLHDAYADTLARWESLPEPPAPPWSTLFPEPTEWAFQNVSSAVLDLIAAVQTSSTLTHELAALRATWSRSAVIHGDFRWRNCLVVRHEDRIASAPPQLKIVDWELAGIGDPAWDVGTFFCEYLNAWLSSVPIPSVANPDRFLDLATAPLHEMHQSVRSFWHSYVTTRFCGDQGSEWMLIAACRNAGARLIQTACEELQQEGELTAKAIAMLQLAENVLARPREAAARLLGIPMVRRSADDVPIP
jgi:Phosphotransferase enzyme family